MNHTKELIERAHRGDEKARETLVLENMGLIGSIVRRFAGRGYEQEDLFQIGSIGLLKLWISLIRHLTLNFQLCRTDDYRGN